MICSDVQQRLKQFLEDLLEEREYQEIRAHLEECVSCRKYALSIASLSYRLKEMGQIEVPKDLLSTVLYRLRHCGPESAAALPQAAPPVAFQRAEKDTL